MKPMLDDVTTTTPPPRKTMPAVIEIELGTQSARVDVPDADIGNDLRIWKAAYDVVTILYNEKGSLLPCDRELAWTLKMDSGETFAGTAPFYCLPRALTRSVRPECTF